MRIAFGIVFALVSGCGSSSSRVCVPGAQVACACIGGGNGVQICNSSGSAYGACAPCDGTATGNDMAMSSGPVVGKDWKSSTTNAAYGARVGHNAVVFNNQIWLVGGSPGGNDVWKSSDGAAWTQVTATAAFAARSYHGLLAFNNQLWVLGGTGFQDVWSSADGLTWTSVTTTAPWTGDVAKMSTVFANKMWVIQGGKAFSSTDGANWTTVATISAFVPFYHSLTVFDDGSGAKLWVTGGGNSGNAVWKSADGITWTAATLSAGWGGTRFSPVLLAFDNKLWMLMGLGDSGGTVMPPLDDEWSSADGITWSQTLSQVPFGSGKGGGNATGVVYNSQMWILYPGEVWHTP